MTRNVRVGEQSDGYTNDVTSNRYPGRSRIFRKPHLDMTAPRFHLSSCSVCSARIRTQTDLLQRNQRYKSVPKNIMQLKVLRESIQTFIHFTVLYFLSHSFFSLQNKIFYLKPLKSKIFTSIISNITCLLTRQFCNFHFLLHNFYGRQIFTNW